MCSAAVTTSDTPIPAPPVWISLYYVAFYVVMTGLFALCIYVLMQTIDPYTPDYQDQLKSPGGHSPIGEVAPSGGSGRQHGRVRVWPLAGCLASCGWLSGLWLGGTQHPQAWPTCSQAARV